MKENPNVKNFKNQIYSMGCIQTVSNYTRVVNNQKSSLLDHVYTNLNDNEIVAKTLAFEISDHLPIITLLHKFNVKSPNNFKKKLIRDLRNFVPQQFLNQLHLELNELDLNNQTGEECWDNFQKKIL